MIIVSLPTFFCRPLFITIASLPFLGRLFCRHSFIVCVAILLSLYFVTISLSAFVHHFSFVAIFASPSHLHHVFFAIFLSLFIRQEFFVPVASLPLVHLQLPFKPSTASFVTILHRCFLLLFVGCKFLITIFSCNSLVAVASLSFFRLQFFVTILWASFLCGLFFFAVFCLPLLVASSPSPCLRYDLFVFTYPSPFIRQVFFVANLFALFFHQFTSLFLCGHFLLAVLQHFSVFHPSWFNHCRHFFVFYLIPFLRCPSTSPLLPQHFLIATSFSFAVS